MLGNLALVVIFVKRDRLIVTLNQAAARSVVAGGGEGEPGILRERSHRLNQPFAEGGFADDEPAIVILNRACDNLRGGGRINVDQYYERNIQSLVAAHSVESAFRGAAT